MAGTGNEKIRTIGDTPISGVIAVGSVLQLDALDLKVYFPTGGAGKFIVKKVRSFLTVIITTADSVITVKDDEGTPATMGTLTITESGCAVGNEDSVDTSASANNVITAGGALTLSIDGGAAAGEAIFFIEYVEAE